MLRYFSANDKGTGSTFKINGTLASGTTNYSHYHNASVETDGTFTQYSGSSVEGAFSGAVHKTEISSGGLEIADTSTDQLHLEAIDLVSPTHTSSHYQTFETPYLHELQGGDRNMEQTNLVVTPDGKTWDEVTRDTSYIGNNCVSTSLDATNSNADSAAVWDEWRGTAGGRNAFFNKDFAIARDRVICLKEGYYFVHIQAYGDSTNTYARVYINGTVVSLFKNDTANNSIQANWLGYLHRGDYVQSFSEHEIASDEGAQFQISRVK